MKKKDRSLVRLITTSFLALCLITLFVGGSFQIYMHSRIIHEQVQKQLKEASENIAHNITHYLTDRVDHMQGMVTFTRGYSNDDQYWERNMMALMGQEYSFFNLVLKKRDGSVAAGASRGAEFFYQQFLLEMEDFSVELLRESRYYISEIYIKPSNNEPYIVMAVPVYTFLGEYYGGLIAEVNLKYVWDIVEDLDIGDGGYAYIVNSSGDLLAATDLSLALSLRERKELEEMKEFVKNPRQRNFFYRGVYGSMVAGSFSNLSLMKWTVILEQPVLKAYGGMIKIILVSLSVLVVLGGLAIWAGIRVARFISAPINALTQMVVSIDEGNYNWDFEIDGSEEVLFLSNTFKSMAQHLVQLVDMEEERTQELEWEIIHREHTEQELRDSESKYKNLYETSKDAIIIFNPAVGLIDCNSAALEIFNISSKEEFVLLNVDDLSPEWQPDGQKSSDRTRETVYQVLREESCFYEWTYKKTDGREFPSVVRAVKMQWGGKILVHQTIRDITRRKKAEEELIKANTELKEHKENLEFLVKERTAELEESLENLKNAQIQLIESEKLAALGGLVAGIAHEINTPIGIGVTAASHLDEVSKELKEILDEGRLTRHTLTSFIESFKEMVQIILTNLNRASRLIRSFKEVAVDQTSEELRNFNLNDYISEILSSVHSQFKHTRHTIEVHCPGELILQSYPGAIAQILTNLLMNSLIHGFEGVEAGQIEISVEDTGDDVKMTYRDTGNGISEDHLKKIFLPFFTTKRGEGGSGLGMNIVYNLVTKTLEGSIYCKSLEKEFTSFIMEFPKNLIKPEQ